MAGGRPKTPSEDKTGHYTDKQKLRMRQEEKAVRTESDQLRKPPTWLIDRVAKYEWKRLVEELDKIGVIGNLDLNHLAGYCNAYSSYRKATKELKGQELMIEKETPSGKKLVENPLIGIQRKYAEEMRKFAALCGLTVSSRLKVGAAKVDAQEEALERKFGNL